LREVVGIGAGGVQRPGQGDALREDHVDAAARVDFDHREDLLGEADVVLGEPVQGLAHAGAQTGFELFAGVDGARGAQRRDRQRGGALREGVTDAAGHAGEQGVGEDLPLLGDQASAHAGLAVLAGHVALHRHVDGRAVAGDARQ